MLSFFGQLFFFWVNSPILPLTLLMHWVWQKSTASTEGKKESLFCSCTHTGHFKYVLGCLGPLRRALTSHPERACHHFSASADIRHFSSKYLLNFPCLLCSLGKLARNLSRDRQLSPGELLWGSSVWLLKVRFPPHTKITSGHFLFWQSWRGFSSCERWHTWPCKKPSGRAQQVLLCPKHSTMAKKPSPSPSP